MSSVNFPHLIVVTCGWTLLLTTTQIFGKYMSTWMGTIPMRSIRKYLDMRIWQATTQFLRRHRSSHSSFDFTIVNKLE